MNSTFVACAMLSQRSRRQIDLGCTMLGCSSFSRPAQFLNPRASVAGFNLSPIVAKHLPWQPSSTHTANLPECHHIARGNSHWRSNRTIRGLHLESEPTPTGQALPCGVAPSLFPTIRPASFRQRVDLAHVRKVLCQCWIAEIT